MFVSKCRKPALIVWILAICAWPQNNSGGVVTPQGWQAWIQESGKKSGGTSSFICATGQVLIGRQHQGDENGNTRYQCATISFDGASISPAASQQAWSAWIQESGKTTGGQSQYQCPQAWVMLGRRHQGDENGNTSYLCAPIVTLGDTRVLVTATDWSAPIQESGKNLGGTSSFVCPNQQIMIGRRHRGDENGNTWYLCAKFVWSQSPILTGTRNQGPWIQESGKNSGGESSYVCPPGSLMIGRAHQGDENGNTMYWCSQPARSLVNVPSTRQDGPWNSWIQESGKNSGGESSFVCPAGQALIGRQHQGDENGNTRYQCAQVFMQGSLVQFAPSDWGPWIQESGKNSGGQSVYVCAQDSFMVGRQHNGDENGNTRYRCASANVTPQPATLNLVYQLAENKVGDPATRNDKQFVSRSDMGIPNDYYLHLDIGGEGYHSVHGVVSGFADAININAMTEDSQPPHNPIPLLIHVADWSTTPPYPFDDLTANYMTMQGAPLRAAWVNEFARVVVPGGSIGFWIDMDDPEQQENVNSLARKLNTSWYYSCSSSKSPCSPDCFDEFFGQAGHPKVCIQVPR